MAVRLADHLKMVGHLKCINRQCIKSFGGQKVGSSNLWPLPPPTYSPVGDLVTSDDVMCWCQIDKRSCSLCVCMYVGVGGGEFRPSFAFMSPKCTEQWCVWIPLCECSNLQSFDSHFTRDGLKILHWVLPCVSTLLSTWLYVTVNACCETSRAYWKWWNNGGYEGLGELLPWGYKKWH